MELTMENFPSCFPYIRGPHRPSSPHLANRTEQDEDAKPYHAPS